MSINKILFIGLSSVGDVVMTTPVLASLQNEYPKALFDIVVDKRGIELYKNFPKLNKVYLKDKDKPLRGVPDLLLQLWKNRYDLIVDMRTDGLAYLLRAKKRYTKFFARSYGSHAIEDLMGIIAPLHGDRPIPPCSRGHAGATHPSCDKVIYQSLISVHRCRLGGYLISSG